MKYLYVNTRGFANEFSVYSITPDLMKQAKAIIESYKNKTEGKAMFVTREEAEQITAKERQKAREQKRMGLNLFQNPVGATFIEPLERW